MGEVYRARDTKLEREVAIKVLPEAFAADAERMARFEREARAASALNHPNIVTIYGFGEQGGTAYIAMELVEGTTLRALIDAGSIPAERLIQQPGPVPGRGAVRGQVTFYLRSQRRIEVGFRRQCHQAAGP